jgi:hypothetical protein
MDQLNAFVQESRQQGQSDDQIRQSLIASGWNNEQINTAFAVLAPTPPPLATPTVTDPSQSPPVGVYPGTNSNVIVGQNPVLNSSSPNGAFVGSLGSEQANTKVRHGFNKKYALILLLALVLVIGIVLILSILMHHKNNSGLSSSSKSVSENVVVPKNWKPFNTGLGFSVMEPSSWSSEASSSSTFNNLKSNSLTLSATGGSVPVGTTTQQQINESVFVGNQSVVSNSSQQAFDNAVSSLSSSDKAALTEFGINASKTKIVATQLKLNGRQWLQVSTDIPNQDSDNLYLWDKNHAITLIVENQSLSVVQQLTKSYLLPMAASVKLTPKND